MRVSFSRSAASQLEKKRGVLGGTIAPKKAAPTLFKHGVVIVAGARRVRFDRRGALCSQMATKLNNLLTYYVSKHV